MNTLSVIPFASTAAWLADVVDYDLPSLYKYDIYHSDTIMIANDPDELMLVFARNDHLIFMNHLDEFRLSEMIKLRPDVMRECVRMIRYIIDEPSDGFLTDVSNFIMKDKTSVELLVEAWLIRRWRLTPIFVFIIQDSYAAWKFFHCANDGSSTSQELIKQIYDTIHSASNYHSMKKCIEALLGTNGSVLEYLIHIDKVNGTGMEQTIITINGFNLWEVVLLNPAASAIIDYALDHFHLVLDGAFYSKRLFQNWLIPKIQESSFIERYITTDDMKCNLIGNDFYMNPYAIKIIEQWFNEGGDISDNILYGLFTIAASEHEQAAMNAIQIIYGYVEIYGIDQIKPDQFVILLKSPFGSQAALYLLNKYGCDLKHDIIELSDIVPHWHDSQLRNLRKDTVMNIRLNTNFWYETENKINNLKYDNWILLLDTQKGIKLGLKYIGLIIVEGVTSKLLSSPMIDKDTIKKLSIDTDVLDFLQDDDLFSIVNRSDAYTIDLKKVYEHNHKLCLEILQAYYEPSRLMRFANAVGMDLRSYLGVV